MNRYGILFSLGMCAMSSAVLAKGNSNAFKFDLMHTVPECHHQGKPTTWCSSEDTQNGADRAGMEKRVVEILDAARDPSDSRIVIAYFSFSNKAAFNKLCERGKAGISIEGFFDKSYGGDPTNLPGQLEANCQSGSKHNVRIHYLGDKNTSPGNFVWRLHHNKFLMVDPGGDDPIRLNFSSGNLSAYGLSLHFDHWVVMQADRDTALVKQHMCVVSALQKAIDPDGSGHDREVDDPKVYRQSLDSCLKKYGMLGLTDPEGAEKLLAKEKIAPLFAPNPNNDVFNTLVANVDRVKKGGHLSIAIQHFLYPEIAQALTRAVKRGVKVQMIMDDDVVLGMSEVPGVKQFYYKYLVPSKSGIDIRFMRTNADTPPPQMMHNKFLVMEGVDGNKKRVFSGAGHFTSSGMRNNYENFYLSQVDDLTAKYLDLFEYMWDRSASESEVLAAGSPVQAHEGGE
ncbi:MAG: hypothetical protein JST16_04060 [Bdellovibrionales bacterium]|nr:hypothetical protein [Bdellovibrionales bacterium]